MFVLRFAFFPVYLRFTFFCDNNRPTERKTEKKKLKFPIQTNAESTQCNRIKVILKFSLKCNQTICYFLTCHFFLCVFELSKCFHKAQKRKLNNEKQHEFYHVSWIILIIFYVLFFVTVIAVYLWMMNRKKINKKPSTEQKIVVLMRLFLPPSRISLTIVDNKRNFNHCTHYKYYCLKKFDYVISFRDAKTFRFVNFSQ